MGECNGDKKHRCFHWELDDELNSAGLKQRYKFVFRTINGSISNFRITLFSFFLIFLKIKIPPYVPRFDITQVNADNGVMQTIKGEICYDNLFL